MKGYAAALALGAVSLLGACTTPPATDPPSSTSTSRLIRHINHDVDALRHHPTHQSTHQFWTGVIPEAAQANTSEGAVAFTQYFLARANEAYSDL